MIYIIALQLIVIIFLQLVQIGLSTRAKERYKARRKRGKWYDILDIIVDPFT